MSDSDNSGSDLESDSFGSHLGASDEEVDECDVNAVRMQPTLSLNLRDKSVTEDWGASARTAGGNICTILFCDLACGKLCASPMTPAL